MKKSLVAGASVAALAMAAVPFAGVFAADVTDTIEVTVVALVYRMKLLATTVHLFNQKIIILMSTNLLYSVTTVRVIR